MRDDVPDEADVGGTESVVGGGGGAVLVEGGVCVMVAVAVAGGACVNVASGVLISPEG